MKAILEFDLDQPEERRQHLQCVKACDTLCAIHDWMERARRAAKEHSGTAVGETIRGWMAALNEQLGERGVDLDELLR